MARRLTGSIAPGIVLTADYIVQLVAIDPTTGSAVNGVVISEVSMQVNTRDTDEDAVTVDGFAPTFTYSETAAGA